MSREVPPSPGSLSREEEDGAGWKENQALGTCFALSSAVASVYVTGKHCPHCIVPGGCFC